MDRTGSGSGYGEHEPGEDAGSLPRVPVQATAGAGEQPRPVPEAPAGEVAGLVKAAQQLAQDDAEFLAAVVELVAEVRERVLDRKGLTGTELNRSQEGNVLADVKRCAVLEVQYAAGFTVREAQALVGLATGPARLREVATGAMTRGEAPWPLVRIFAECTGARLTFDQRMLVAAALFGTDADLAAEERLDEHGDLVAGKPWSHAVFTAACQREVAAAEGEDGAAERARRRRAYAARRARVRLHDEGTATVSVTGPAATMSAVYQRIDRASRTARGAGDERTLDQLRCDIINALLLYGIITLPSHQTRDGAGVVNPPLRSAGRARPSPDRPGCGCDHDEDCQACADGADMAGAVFDELIAPEDIEYLVRVINAQPPVALQVIVPVDVLAADRPRCQACGNPADPPTDSHVDDADDPSAHDPPPFEGPDCAPPPSPAAGPDSARHAEATGQDSSRFEGGQDGGDLPGEGEAEDVPHWERMLAPFLAPPGPGRGQVAELLGPVPFFATPGHARELALTPGSMFYRLLVDPHDGRRVERTIKTYRPDTHMRRQIHAADVYARTPGTRTPLGAAEIDHVTPYAAGGPTAETNLAVLDPWPGHKSKTLGYLDVVINDRRDLTFTTLLRQVHTTRAHDYNQYLHTRAPSDLDTRRDLANQTLYAAHAQRARSHRHRRPGEPAPWLTLTHTVRGQTRPGPAPGTPTIEELLDTTTDADQTDPDQTTPDQSEA